MGVRRATPGDLAAVLRIAADGFTGDDAINPAWLIDILAQPGTVLVVDAPGVDLVRGFLMTQRYAHGVIVRLIAVASEFRGQGVGKMLLARVKGPAGAWVRKENKASRAMFERAGWEKGVPKWKEAAKPVGHTGEWAYFTLSRKSG